jgi:hypothetical protein
MLYSAQYHSIIRPSRRRYLGFRILVMCAAFQLGFAIYQAWASKGAAEVCTLPVWLFLSVSFLLTYSLSLFLTSQVAMKDLSIAVARGMIAGPGSAPGKRVHFALDRLDTARTRRVSWLNWLLQIRYIWSLDGEKIVVCTYAFEQAELDELLTYLES